MRTWSANGNALKEPFSGKALFSCQCLQSSSNVDKANQLTLLNSTPSSCSSNEPPPKLPSPLQLKRSLSQPKDFSSARKLQNPHNLPKATSLSQNPSSLPASKWLNKSSPLKRSLQPPTSLSPPKTQSASLSKSHVLKLQCYRKSHPKSSRKPPPRKDTMLQKTLPSSLWNPSLPKAPPQVSTIHWLLQLHYLIHWKPITRWHVVPWDCDTCPKLAAESEPQMGVYTL